MMFLFRLLRWGSFTRLSVEGLIFLRWTSSRGGWMTRHWGGLNSFLDATCLIRTNCFGLLSSPLQSPSKDNTMKVLNHYIASNNRIHRKLIIIITFLEMLWSAIRWLFYFIILVLFPNRKYNCSDHNTTWYSVQENRILELILEVRGYVVCLPRLTIKFLQIVTESR